jgi:colanic acid/amylovoran biosynthesis glycosyltransferase
MIEMKPVVLHLVDTFLARSEVFIYNYVSSHVDWEAVILCKSTDNEIEFPVSRRVVVRTPVSKRQPGWWIEQTAGLVTGRSLWHRRVETEIRKLAPTVIHAHFGQMGHAILPVKRRLGVPLITTFYGYDMSVLPRLPGWREKLSELFQDGDLFLVEGEFMRERLIELGAQREKVRIQRIAIHIDRYPAWEPEGDHPVVLFVGRFAEKKGLLHALKAVSEVCQRNRALRFRIVGDGMGRDAAESFVMENGLSKCVAFLGMKPHLEVIQELRHAHVFIHPSRTAANGDTEGGAPTILLEAQAVGVPVVTTRHADIPNVVASGPGAYFSPENETTQLAENLFEAIQRRQGTNPSFVRQQHSIKTEIINLEAHYASLMKR